MSAPKKKPYAIGYGKPPRGRRFERGQSGNPTGRPRTTTMKQIPASIRALFLDILERQVTIREGEETRRISMKEAVLRAHVNTAMKGNALAQRDVRQFAMQCELEAEAAHWENYFFWKDWQETHAALIARGHPADDILPHPDDIILHDDGRITFNGPVSHEHKQCLEIIMRHRDVFFMRGLWEERHLSDEDPSDPTTRMTLFMLFAVWMDGTLPPGLRWDDTKLTIRAIHYESLPERKFLTLLKRTWFEAFHSEPGLDEKPRSLKQLAQAYGYPTFGAWIDHCRNTPVDDEEYYRKIRELEQRTIREEAQKKPRYRVAKQINPAK